MWQKKWDREEIIYLLSIKEGKVTRVGSNWREETVIARLRLGDCALNKTLKIIGKQQTGLK